MDLLLAWKLWTHKLHCQVTPVVCACVCEKKMCFLRWHAFPSENCENGLLLGLHHAHIPSVTLPNSIRIKTTSSLCAWLISGFVAVG